MRQLRAHKFQFLGCLVICSASVFLASCSENNQPPNKAAAQAAAMMSMAVPVTIAEATVKDVPVQVNAIGNVEAYSTVTVKSLVDGQVQRAYFKQGQDVKKGDLLFLIDPRPFHAVLQQAEANLARDLATAKNAKTQAERYTQLEQAGIVSKDQYDQFQTAAQSTDAAVRADQAAVESAKLQLSYCSIYSPITGRTGSLLVYPGNLVKNNDTSLVVINQITPIYVDFSVPEQYLAEIKRHEVRGRLHLFATIPDAPGQSPEGELTFVNNAVDSGTGTIMLKGTFANIDRRLWPGQFVKVVLNLATQPHATVVPSQAVQAGQQGSFVYVVLADQTAQVRPVEVGSTVAGLTIIEKGIKPGERVVTDGQLRLFPGAKVSIRSASASRQESSS